MSILRKTVLAGIGAFELTREKAEKIIDELIAKGELNKSQRAEAIMEVLERAGKNTADFASKFAREAEQAAGKFAQDIKWASRNDFERLESQLKELVARIRTIEDRLNSAETKGQRS